MQFLSVKDAERHCLCTQGHDIYVNVVNHFAPVGGIFACAGIPCLATGNNAYDVNYGRMEGRIDWE